MAISQANALVALDSQMMPGQTYTFSFTLGNLITLPDPMTIQQDIANYGPQYAGNLGVSKAAGIGLFTNYYNVTFTYQGDGSDVVSEVGAELAAAAQQGSNDTLNFNNAYVGSQGQTAGGEIQGAMNAASPALPSTSTLVIIVVGIALLVFVLSGGPGIVRGISEGARA